MSQARPVFIVCKVTRSAFSDERVYRITAANGEVYAGAAPIHYFRREDQSPLRQDEPSEGSPMQALVEAFLISNGGDTVRVAVPDEETIVVRADQVVERGQREKAHVSV